MILWIENFEVSSRPFKFVKILSNWVQFNYDWFLPNFLNGNATDKDSVNGASETSERGSSWCKRLDCFYYKVLMNLLLQTNLEIETFWVCVFAVCRVQCKAIAATQ